MAGGGDHPGANKRNREATGRPERAKRAKRKKPYEDPVARGGGDAKGKTQHVTTKDKRVAAKELEVLWGKMRGRHVSKEDIIKRVTEALRKMDEKFLGISGSHVNASVLHWCSRSESGKVRRHIIRILKKQIMKLAASDYGCLELEVLWGKMRGRHVSKEDIIKLVTEALRKMDGKFLGISGSHVNASVLQTCVKWCSQSESGKGSVFVHGERRRTTVHKAGRPR